MGLCESFYKSGQKDIGPLRQVFIDLHKFVSSSFSAYWNKFTEFVNAPGALEIAGGLWEYSLAMERFELVDLNFVWEEAVFGTYLAKVFSNAVKYFGKLFVALESGVFLSGELLQSGACLGLESHIQDLLNTLAEVPSPYFAEQVLVYSSQVISLFLIDLYFLISTKRYNLKTLVSILNNNLLQLAKQSVKKVHMELKCSVPLKRLKTLMNEAKIHKVSGILQELLAKKLRIGLRQESKKIIDATFDEIDFIRVLKYVILKYFELMRGVSA